jgi:hypothetical protein
MSQSSARHALRGAALATAAITALIAVPVTTGAVVTAVRTQVALDRSLSTHLPPGAMPRMTKRSALPANAPAGAHLSYFGGPVLSHINSIAVKWGAGSYQPFIGTYTGAFTTQYLKSSVMDWLTEYNTPGGSAGTGQSIGHGSYGGMYTITPSVTGTTIQDSQVQSELTAQIQAGHLPQPDANTSYTIFFPHGITICMGTICSAVAGGFCAYHSTFVYGSVDATYQVMPDNQPGSGEATGCGNGTATANETSVLSHELAETITDPLVGLATAYAPPLAWYDTTNGEIADICNAQQGDFVGSDDVTYTAQLLFSNVNDNCVLTATTSAASFTSPASATFSEGVLGTFTPTASGSPVPTISESGVLPTGVSFTAGVLTGTPTQTGLFPITLTAHNGVGPNATQPFVLTAAEAPHISSGAATTFVKGVKGSFTVTSQAYPSATYSTVGVLPKGVTLSAAGVLTGSPTSTGTFKFSIVASNGVLPNASQAFSLKVVSILITTVSLGTATRGKSYSQQLTHLGGVGHVSWSITSPKLPHGLSISSSGKIKGTVSSPVAPGTYSVGVAIHDSAKPTHNKAKAVLKIVVK